MNKSVRSTPMLLDKVLCISLHYGVMARPLSVNMFEVKNLIIDRTLHYVPTEKSARFSTQKIYYFVLFPIFCRAIEALKALLSLSAEINVHNRITGATHLHCAIQSFKHFKLLVLQAPKLFMLLSGWS